MDICDFDSFFEVFVTIFNGANEQLSFLLLFIDIVVYILHNYDYTNNSLKYCQSTLKNNILHNNTRLKNKTENSST